MTAVRVSFVVIGLNEADHLAESLASCKEQGLEPGDFEILYVDSGSSDASIEIARETGVDRVIELSRSGASAARARNAGLEDARGEFIQFVDGDTRLEAGWVRDGVQALIDDEGLAGVEGDLSEFRRDANLYHAVCELEWPATPGPVPFVSGNSLYRTRIIREAGGFDLRMFVGEEPELGARIRALGWRFSHLDRIMGRHDLDMDGFRDWLRRGYRSGLAYGMVAQATRGLGHDFWHDKQRQTLVQAGALVAPWIAALAILPISSTLALIFAGLGAGLASALVVRKAVQLWRAGTTPKISIAYAIHSYLIKIPSAAAILVTFTRTLPPGHAARSNAN